ncbi:MAG: aminotransferase class V-fold PLP-dependent enzyme [Planctomycetes bacterium]|nr:aminotransferase class V-fold PLP-dependent enzyme [Planctomycetota bacterium]
MSQTNESRRRFMQHAVAAGALGALFLREDALERVHAAGRRVDGRGAEEVAADEDYWFAVQQAFTVDRSLINFNNGGVSPSPAVVQEAMRRHLEYANNAPSRNLWQLQDPEVETVRARLARTFGCDSEEMAITRNSSESLEICIYGIDLARGDEVLTNDQDYPRMINTYKQRELREGIVVKSVPVPAPVDDPAELLDAYARGITPRTKVILVSHIVNLTGQIFPVRDIVRLGRERGIPVISDGAHAFAHWPFSRDELECDYYGTSLHKWLTAPHGTGFLYVRKSKIGSLWPLMAAAEPKSDDIRKYEEIGTHPAANRLAISEALTFHHGIGPARKAARLRYLRDRWANRLLQDKRVRLYCRLDPQHSCGIATVTVDGIDNGKLSSYLFKKHRIITTTIGHKQIKGVRVSPNVYSTINEVDMFCEAVEEVLANGLPA